MGIMCPLNRKCLYHAGLWAKLLAAVPETLVLTHRVDLFHQHELVHSSSFSNAKTSDYMGVVCPLNRECLNHTGLWAKLLACVP